LSGSDRDSGVDVRLFGVLWAGGLLLHYARPNDSWNLGEPVHIVAAASIGLLLARPSWSIAWVLVALTQIADALYTSVTVNNVQMSWTIVAAVHAAVLIALASVWHHPKKERAQRTLDLLAPALRAVVLLVYFFAVFHKLNADYFSSINTTPMLLMRRMPLLGGLIRSLHLESFGTYFGIGMEAVIFGLLLVRRLRVLGVLVAFALHFGLGWIGFRQFLIMFPLLLLFVRPTTPLPPLPQALGRVTPFVLPAAVVTFLMWNESTEIKTDLVLPLFVLGGALFLFELGRRMRAHGVLNSGRQHIGPGRSLDVALPVLFTGLCLLPYIGVTTHPCMTMYSHLSVHSGKTNHYLMPASLQIDAIHNDTVRIIGTSSPRRFPMGAVVPRLALRKSLLVTALRGKAPRFVVYKSDTDEVRIARGYLPDAAWYELLPMISFNGPSALRGPRVRAKFAPRIPKGVTPMKTLPASKAP
jgi:hypothetical protein